MTLNEKLLDFVDRPFIPQYGMEKTFNIKGISCRLFVYPDKSCSNQRHLEVTVNGDFTLYFMLRKTTPSINDSDWLINPARMPPDAEKALTIAYEHYHTIKEFFVELLDINQ